MSNSRLVNPADPTGYWATYLRTIRTVTPTGTSADAANWTAAGTAMAAVGGKIIAKAGTHTITSDVTIPSNVVVEFMPGAVLDISTGITVTIHGVVYDNGMVSLGAGTLLLTRGYQRPTRVMLCGDSQTTGSSNVPGGSRKVLWRLARGAGVDLRLVGPYMAADTPSASVMYPWPGDPFVAAVGGYTILDLKTLFDAGGSIYTYVGTFGAPDIIFVMIGTNDIYTDTLAAAAWTRVQSLLTSIRALCPYAHIVFESIPSFYSPASPFGGLAAAAVQVAAYNALLSTVSSLDANTSYLDACAGLSRADMHTDGIHLGPTAHNERGSREFTKLVAVRPTAALANQKVPRVFQPRTKQASAKFTAVATDQIYTTADDGWRLPAGNFLGGARVCFQGAIPTTFAAICQATQSGGNYTTGWLIAFDGASSPKALKYYDNSGGGSSTLIAQTPLIADKPFWLFWHGDRATGTVSLWIAQAETARSDAPWTLMCVGRVTGLAAWSAGTAGAIMTAGKNASFNGFVGIIDSIFYCNTGVAGFNDIRSDLERIVFDGGTVPTKTAELRCNEGSSTTCASSMGGTSGTLAGSWSAAGTVSWPSDDS
jgi:hypothetical protein